MLYPILALLFYLLMLIYFRIADHYNIIDHPNERSSHAEITIRGGGVIFLFAAIVAAIFYPSYWLPVLGIFIIGTISFIDDKFTISVKLRTLVHLIAVTVLFFYLQLFVFWPWYVCIALYVMVIGIINMYNFMDGINGITGAYSLVVLGGLQYVNLQHAFVETDMIWIPMLACAVFLFFNFRKKAKCFAGDVGSVTIAFWIVLLLLHLIVISGHWQYVLFLAVYGVDSVLTIGHRLLLKQNIFKAHRLHFYQLLVNEQGVPHLRVAAGYAILQAFIIMIIVLNLKLAEWMLFSLIIVPLLIIYIAIKPRLIKI
jgi:UDP-N-acetylmuramyl pentapeptide phosphotransferase/UDP-N-acetylglucosamine-1-phosphate transferase